MALTHSHRTLAESLAGWSAEHGDRPAYTFVDFAKDPRGIPRTVSWAELDRWTTLLAVRLQHTAGAGARAAILAPQGLGYIVAILGCLRAGVIGVPLLVPDTPATHDRLSAIMADCDPEVVLTTLDALPTVREFVDQQPMAGPKHLIAVDDLDRLEELDGARASRWTPPDLADHDVAYLQYTSGSTGVPAGAMITYANFAANAAQAARAYRLGADTHVVSWLPLFHDMGLLLAVGVPVLLGVRAVFMAPFAFLQRPVRWLRLLSEYPEAFAAAPNFAFDHCARRVSTEDRRALDLSRVHVLINGSEPVRADTVERFADAFAPSGLPARAHRPSYGLAEATVLVSATERSRVTVFDVDALDAGSAREAAADARRTRRLVASGLPADQVVRIVDQDTRTELPAGRIGEIWVHGPNVAVGYWNRPDKSAETFGAELDTPTAGTPPGPWLRTGDLGFFHDGQLHIAGRGKDMIIVDGQNHYPQDIEATVEQVHPVIRRDRVAVFGVSEGEQEMVVVLAELDRGAAGQEVDLLALERAVRSAVTQTHNVRMHEFLLVRARAIPRTSSGKVQRSACRERYQSGELATVSPTPAPSGGRP